MVRAMELPRLQPDESFSSSNNQGLGSLGCYGSSRSETQAPSLLLLCDPLGDTFLCIAQHG